MPTAMDRVSSEGSNCSYEEMPGSSFFSEATLGDIGEQDEPQEQPTPGEWRDDLRVWMKARNPARPIQKRSSSSRGRTLVLCFDGTGDSCDADNSNVVNFVSLLKKHQHDEQLVYYQAGIGTYTNVVVRALGLKYIYELLDEMLAINLRSHVEAGYEFLMQNYTIGDKICIFGFSRGAYTARALAGMLQKVGLLPLCNHQQVPFAYDSYQRTDEEGLKICETFKRTFCHTVHVDFLGVWDTVASVGSIPQYLPFVAEDNGIHYLRHALSLDERRVKFLPTFSANSRKKVPHPGGPIKADIKQKAKAKAETPLKEFEDEVNAATGRATDVSQVWFAGVHTDVGGGSVRNETKHALARIPLRWMIRECFRCDTGIIFDAIMLQQLGIAVDMDRGTLLPVPQRIPGDKQIDGPPPPKPSLLARIARSFGFGRHSSPKDKMLSVPGRRHDTPYAPQQHVHEAEEEWRDARSPMHDQLKSHWWLWLLMEWIPWRIKKNHAILEETDDLNSYEWIWNRGRGREIHRVFMDAGMRVHRSVKTRLEAKGLPDGEYVPRVRPHIIIDGKDKCQIERLKYDQWTAVPVKYWEWVDDWSPGSDDGYLKAGAHDL